MKISKDIYLVGSGEIRLSNEMDSHVYLIDGGDELALIDSGVGLETSLIIENIRCEGFDPTNVNYLLLTHSHADHAGGATDLVHAFGCMVFAPEIEKEAIESGTEADLGLDRAKRDLIYPVNYSFRHCKVDESLRDNEELMIGKYRIKTIHVPGHSWCSSCYLLKQADSTSLFSSDIVFWGGTIGLGNWPGSSLEAYRDNIEKLERLYVDALFPGHFSWTLKDGQKHLNQAIENLRSAWVPPAWRHRHPHR